MLKFYQRASNIIENQSKCESNKPDIGPIDVEPIDPVKPIDPDIILPTDPIKPIDPEKPVDPTKPTDPVKPVDDADKPEIVKPVDDMTTEEICAVYCKKNCTDKNGDVDPECMDTCNEKCLTGNAEKPPGKPIEEIKPDEVEVDQVCDLLCEKKCADAENPKECMQRCGENCNGEDFIKPPTLAPPTSGGSDSGSKPVITEIDPNDVEVDQVCELLCDKRCSESDDPKCMDKCQETCINNQQPGNICFIPKTFPAHIILTLRRSNHHFACKLF